MVKNNLFCRNNKCLPPKTISSEDSIYVSGVLSTLVAESLLQAQEILLSVLTIGSFPGFERFLKHIFWSILEKNHLQIFSFSLESLFSLVSCCINPIHLYSWHSECYFLFSAKYCGSLGSLPLLYSPSP